MTTTQRPPQGSARPEGNIGIRIFHLALAWLAADGGRVATPAPPAVGVALVIENATFGDSVSSSRLLVPVGAQL